MSAHIGAGYGSEFHLMRIMARHRREFDRRVVPEIQGQVTEWLDFGHGGTYDAADPGKVKLPDKEWRGLAFLPSATLARVAAAWKAYWPQTGNLQNWDAVGRARIEGTECWLLVEAKGHLGELKSNCGAKAGSKSEPQIAAAFAATQRWLGIRTCGDWCKTYYQAANRLAFLHFLHTHDIPAKLLFIYFCGDQNPDANCPTTDSRWEPALEAQAQHLGLTQAIKQRAGVHSLFWPIR